jgi:hypothetical protein
VGADKQGPIMTATPRSKLLLLSGLFLAAAATATAGGCSSDDSAGGGADSGADGAVAPGPDSSGPLDASSGHDAHGSDGAGPGVDGGSTDSSVDGGSDTGAPDGGGGDTGSDGGGTDDGGTEGGGTDGGGEGSADAAANVPNDPIAVWNFDEGTGSLAFDSSGHGHTATLRGGATFGLGKHGTGLSPNASGWAVVPATEPDAGSADAGSSADASDVSDAGVADAGTDATTTDAEVADAADASDGASDDATADSDSGGSLDAGPAFAPLVFDTTKSFSIVCWVKVYSSGPNQWQSAFSRDGQNLSVFTLKLRGDSPAPAPGEQFDFDFPGADNTGTGIYTVAQSATSPVSSLADGGADHWYHLAGVLNRDPADAGAATVSIYVNGVAESTAMPNTNPILAAVGDTIIGASLFNGRGASWNGVIDDVSLYDRALSAAEVNALYETTK